MHPLFFENMVRISLRSEEKQPAILNAPLLLRPMKYLVAITLLFSMIVQTFQMGIIEADFIINRDQIAATLCENKDKPQMQCHGSCQLKKELEKQDKKATLDLSHEIQPFIVANGIEPLNNMLPSDMKSYLPYQSLQGILFAPSLLHPPAQLS